MKAKPLLLTVLLLFALCTPLALTNIPIGLCATDSQTILASWESFNATEEVSYELDFIAEPSYRIHIDCLLVNTSTQQIAYIKFPKNVSANSPSLSFGLTHEDDGRLIIDWITTTDTINLAQPTDFAVKESAYDIEIVWDTNILNIKYWNGTKYTYALENYDLDAFDIGKIVCFGGAVGGYSSGHMKIAVTELSYGALRGMFDEILPLLMYLMVIGCVIGMIGGVTKKMGKW